MNLTGSGTGRWPIAVLRHTSRTTPLLAPNECVSIPIFNDDCYRCHGDRGAAKGGMAYITDLAKLVERKKVVPGNPGDSKL